MGYADGRTISAGGQRIVSSPGVTSHQSYLPGVDGLRCLAVFAVLLFHAHLFEAGWAGVWLFFAISGFVITRSLRAIVELGLPPSEILRRFYLKRSFRILPLYLASIFVFSLVILAFSSDWREKLNHLLYLLTFTYNFYRLGSGYVHNAFFGHFWSLSVEEQFYFTYPVLLIFLGAARLRYALAAALIVFPIVRLIVSSTYGDLAPQAHVVDVTAWRGNALYQLGVSQFDAFAVGALIALNEARIRTANLVLPVVASIAAMSLALYAAVYGPLFGGLEEAFRVNIYGDYAEVWLYSVLNFTS